MEYFFDRGVQLRVCREKFLGEFFGRFVGFERIGFIQHIFSSVREEGTKIFLEEKNKRQVRRTKRSMSLTSRSYLK